MFSLAQIQDFSAAAGREASRERKVPFAPFPEDDLDEVLRGIPNLGVYCPKDWERVDLECLGAAGRGIYYGDNQGYGAFFVDSSGLDGPGGAALSYADFVEAVKSLFDVQGYGYGLAICEESQFQVKIGVYQRR